MRKLLVSIILFIFAAVLPVYTQAEQTPATPKAKTSGSPAVKAASKAFWEVEWGKVIAESKKEGEVVITLGPGFASSYRQEIVKEIQSKYGQT